MILRRTTTAVRAPPPRLVHPFLLLLPLLSIVPLAPERRRRSVADAARTCPPLDGGGTCPDSDACCPLPPGVGGPSSSSGCIASDPRAAAAGGLAPECCTDDVVAAEVGGTGSVSGCGAGYECASSSSFSPSVDDRTLPPKSIRDFGTPSGGRRRYYCRYKSNRDAEDDAPDSLDFRPPPVTPRYRLCPLPSSRALTEVYGFPVVVDDGDDDGGHRRRTAGLLAYLSTRGSVVVPPAAPAAAAASSSPSSDDAFRDVKLVVVTVHGSLRNADEYLYGTHCASTMQGRYGPREVLVLAPRFLSPDDGDVDLARNDDVDDDGPEQRDDDGGGGGGVASSFLRWAEEGPIPHTWRYGADSIRTAGPSSSFSSEGGGAVASSYAAMDRLVEHFVFDERDAFGSLERVVVVGHSAGGQFVQRWALTSPSPAWTAAAAHASPLQTSRGGSEPRVRARRATVRAVVANPRSFAYLTPARYVVDGDDGDGGGGAAFRVPDPSSIESCPTYDRWEWGLEPGGRLSAPYKDDSLKRAGGVEALIENYGERDVLYLAGREDREEITAECEDDDFQGRTRFERSELFHRSLGEVYAGRTTTTPPHARVVVEGVGHDHGLMYQSPEGLEALFGV